MLDTNHTESDEDSPIPPAARAVAASRSTWVHVVLSTTQIVVGVLSKSQGLIADGNHCLSDQVADCVVLFANRTAPPPQPESSRSRRSVQKSCPSTPSTHGASPSLPACGQLSPRRGRIDQSRMPYAVSNKSRNDSALAGVFVNSATATGNAKNNSRKACALPVANA